jgi:TrmH family RNA methyltransferase
MENYSPGANSLITSAQNPKIQQVQSLLTRHRERQDKHAFIIEGVRLSEEALAARWFPTLVLYSEHLNLRGQEVLEKFRRENVEVEEISKRLMESIAETESPQGLLAIIPIRSLPLPDKLDFILIADEIRDPGNLGTLLRTAIAAGVQLVILSPGTTDAFSPKVVRAGMGAQFRLPIFTMTWDLIANLCNKQVPPLQLLLAESEQGTPCWNFDLKNPLALVIGGEAEGAGFQARKNADLHITIPMPGKSESLNAAVAAGILIFEVVRQRQKA